eukprot:m51a1_g3214 hypothetical protein (331) ;mRNA; f:36904-38204
MRRTWTSGRTFRVTVVSGFDGDEVDMMLPAGATTFYLRELLLRDYIDPAFQLDEVLQKSRTPETLIPGTKYHYFCMPQILSSQIDTSIMCPTPFSSTTWWYFELLVPSFPFPESTERVALWCTNICITKFFSELNTDPAQSASRLCHVPEIGTPGVLTACTNSVMSELEHIVRGGIGRAAAEGALEAFRQRVRVASVSINVLMPTWVDELFSEWYNITMADSYDEQRKIPLPSSFEQFAVDPDIPDAVKRSYQRDFSIYLEAVAMASASSQRFGVGSTVVPALPITLYTADKFFHKIVGSANPWKMRAQHDLIESRLSSGVRSVSVVLCE